MAIAFVQAATQVSETDSPSTAPSITLTGVTGGNALVLVATMGEDANGVASTMTITSVTDGGNSWTVRSGVFTVDNSRVYAIVAYAVNVTGGSRTVAVNLGNTAGGGLRYFTLGLMEWSGMATSSPEDAFDANDDVAITAADVNAGPITTTEATDLIVGAAAIGTDTGGVQGSFGSPASWTNRYRQNDLSVYFGHDSGSWLPGSIQTNYTAQWSHANTNMTEGCAVVVAIKSAGAETVTWLPTRMVVRGPSRRVIAAGITPPDTV